MAVSSPHLISTKVVHFESSYPHQQLLMLAYYTCVELNWQVNYFSQKGVLASSLNHSDEIQIIISNNHVEITASSKRSRTQWAALNDVTIHAFLNQWHQTKQLYNPEKLQTLYDDIAPHLTPLEEEKILTPDSKNQNSFTAVIFNFLKPKEGYFFTPIILYSNLLIFILMILDGGDFMSPGSKVLIKWGANYTVLTRDGEWWRLLTSCFVHIGVLHLLMNMFTFIFISLIIEPLIGKWYYLCIYLLSGIAGSIASLWWHDITISAGASGAIFGLFGAYLVLLTTHLIEKSKRKQLLLSATIFLILNLGNGMKEGVDNMAHIGGLLAGMFFYLSYFTSFKK
ncbi:MAG: peptidase [Bacteroidetes bacterium OLB11]|nr:MAG: peptidase [Bacteroidetes bacterium OLB11]